MEPQVSGDDESLEMAKKVSICLKSYRKFLSDGISLNIRYDDMYRYIKNCLWKYFAFAKLVVFEKNTLKVKVKVVRLFQR